MMFEFPINLYFYPNKKEIMKNKLTLFVACVFATCSISFAQLGGAINKVKNKAGEAKPAEKANDAKEGGLKAPENKTDKYYVSDFHRSNTGKILFSPEVKPDVATTQNFKSEYDTKDDVTGCVYLKPIAAWSRNFKVKIFIDGTEAASFTDKLTDNMAAFTLRIRRKMGSTESNDFDNKVLKLANGTYKIKLEMWSSEDGIANDKEKVAEGEFTLTKMIKEEVPTAKWGDYKAKMKNPGLEQQGLKLVNDKATKEGWKEKYTKAIIISDDWEIVKNQYTSEIIERKIYMLLYGEWPDGKCKVVDFGFKQDYAGGGKYTDKLQYNGIGSMKLIICEPK